MIKNGQQKSKKTFTLQHVKESNLAIVFSLIMQHESISRAEIVQRTLLSPTTVSALVQELINDGLVFELGAQVQESSGRRPIMLKGNPKGGYCFSIELLGDGFLLALYDITCHCLWSRRAVDDYSDLFASVVSAIEHVPAELQPGDKLMSVSIGLPGHAER